MNWVSAALTSSFLFAIVAVLDKRLLATYVPTVKSFFFLVGLVMISFAGILSLTVPWSSHAPLATWSIAVSSGVVWGFSLLLTFYGISRLDVSRVIAISHTYPAFVTIMAVLFLEERLSAIQIAATLAIIIGAGLVTTDQKAQQEKENISRVYLLVLLGSVLHAIANVAYKYALNDIAFWDLLALRSLCLGLVLTIAGYHGEVIKDIREAASNKAGVLLFIATEIVIAPIGLVTMVAALALGPVSVASTIFAIRPLFVLIISGLLSTRVLNLLDEPFTSKTLPLKFGSTLLIVVGVAILILI